MHKIMIIIGVCATLGTVASDVAAQNSSVVNRSRNAPPLRSQYSQVTPECPIGSGKYCPVGTLCCKTGTGDDYSCCAPR